MSGDRHPIPKIPATPPAAPLHTERAARRPRAHLFSGAAPRVALRVVRNETRAAGHRLSMTAALSAHAPCPLHPKVDAQQPVTLTPLTFLASLCAPLRTTPPHAHRSTSTSTFSLEIDQTRPRAARAAGALAVSRSPNPHSPTPTSRRVCAVPSLAVAVALCSPEPPCFSARQMHRSSLRARARARFVSRRRARLARRRRDSATATRLGAAAAAAQRVEPTAAAPELDRIMYCYAPMSNVPGP